MNVQSQSFALPLALGLLALVGALTVMGMRSGKPPVAQAQGNLIRYVAPAGVDAGMWTDVDGQPRPYQAPDLGADKYWPPGVLKYFYLPLALRNHVP
jgi:hypothetical protein